MARDYRNHNVSVDDGREANRQFWAGFFAALPDLTATMEDLVVSGDRVVGRFAYRGTHSGEFMGIPATGRSVEMRSIDIWRVADGIFVEHWPRSTPKLRFIRRRVIAHLECRNKRRGW